MRRVLSMLFCCCLLQFAGGSVASGQQTPSPTLAEGASLSETIQWLDSRLVRYGEMRYYDPFGPFEHKYYDTRFEYLRAEGCVIRYRHSAMRSDDEYSTNLADLDPAQVRAEVPKNWKGGRVVFSSIAGGTAIMRHTRGGKTQRQHTGAFGVSDRRALDGIAEALRRAISSCRS